MNYKRVLTIAGSDPSGGAGIQADLKTISACGCYGMSAITAVVDENTVQVNSIYSVPASFVQRQIKSVLDDIGANAIKIGMLHSSKLIYAVKETLSEYDIRNTVLDPVMVATSGSILLEKKAINVLKNELIPQMQIITPNIPEAEILLNEKINRQEDLSLMAQKLSCHNTVSVFLKAGHLTGEELTDVFYNAESDEIIQLSSKRIATRNTHGTGCTLSSAIASFLARGFSLNDAVLNAKEYTNQAIIHGAEYKIGKGHGPVHYFYQFWK
jgi:hydroxymethylpyrimidine/phosphomethylpyrimidine kinase